MSRFMDLPHRYTILVTGTALLLIVALADSPNGWLEFVCLLPLVLTAGFMETVYLAPVCAIGFVLSVSFGSVPWVPQPTTVLFVVSVLCLLQIQNLRDNLRRMQTQLDADQKQQRVWRTFFENSPAAILAADGDGKIVMANPAAYKLFGLEGGPLPAGLLRSCLQALASALQIERPKPVFQAITGCKGRRLTGDTFLADVWFSVTAAPSETRLGAVIVDASERLQEREQWVLRSSMTTSQIAIGAVLHEIRNLSSAATLMHSNLARLKRMQGNSDFVALGHLLKAQVQIASSELRPVEGSYSNVDLCEVLGQLRIVIDPWFRGSEMCVKWNISSDLPHVWGEEPGLLQIFLNLAKNSNRAMQSSQQKQLTISAKTEGEVVAVRFCDTGPGVTNSDDLFRPFQSSSRVKGLGLYVSRAIAHSFCGDLKYEPLPVGACFSVELVPLRECETLTGEYESATLTNQNFAHS